MSSERQRIAYLRHIKIDYYDFISFILSNYANSRTAIYSAMDLTLKRKGIIAESLAIQHIALQDHRSLPIAQKTQELQNLRSQVANMELSGPTELNPESLALYHSRLKELRNKKEQIESELGKLIPAAKRTFLDSSLEEILESIPKGAAIIEFIRVHFIKHTQDSKGVSLEPPHYIAFALNNENEENIQMIDLGEAERIDKLATNFTISITGVNTDRNLVPSIESPDQGNEDWKAIGYDLYKLIFYPLLSAIGDCTRLFIAPDGDLTRVSFEVLHIGNNAKLMIDKYSISYLTTARDLLRINNPSNDLPDDPLIAANPDFDLSSNNTGNDNNTTRNTVFKVKVGKPISSRQSRDLNDNVIHFQRLAGTIEEGEEISKLLKVQPLMAEKVLESRIKFCISPGILHIATHGFFLPNQDSNPNKIKRSNLMEIEMAKENDSMLNRLSRQNLENPMLRSGLALDGANTWLQNGPLPAEAEDGILTAEDVSGMDLSNTELVVLSACDTGLGDILTGEGVFGLRRAFVLAGAQTLVMSLWKVPDQQTKELMLDFYKHLLSGKGRAEALRKAQLAMKQKYQDPYYWGAFICQGNPGPLSNELLKSIKEKKTN
jgi:CHAT domain-containing protein